MSFAEKLKGIAGGVIDTVSSQRTHDKVSVSLEDLKVGVWRNGDKSSIRVISLDPLDLVMCSKEDPIDKPLILEDLEALRKKLEEEHYSFETVVVPLTPDSKIVDLDAVRVATGGESISSEQEHKNALTLESEQVTTEIEEQKVGIFKKFVELAEALGKKKKSVSRATASRLLEEATTVYQQSLTMKSEQGSKELTSEYMTEYRACLESLRNIDIQVGALVVDVQKLKQPGSLDPVEVGNVAEAHDNLNVLLQARTNASKAEDSVSPVPAGSAIKNKKETAEKGPKGPEDFNALLKARQENVSALIDAINTPESFAEFRRGMRKVQLEGSQEARWYFINQKMLREELSKNEKLKEVRELSDAEKQQLYALEDFLRDKMRRRFFELKDADVANFYDQEQAKIIATQSEADLDTLVESWPKQLGDIGAWKGTLDTLTEVEKNKIDDGYRGVVDTLGQNSIIRRRELQLVPAYQALDAFLGERPKRKETIALMQDIVREAYRVFSEKVTKESEGRISEKECEKLWRQKNGEQKLRVFVVNHLHVIEKVELVEGEKIFRAIIAGLQQGR